MNFKNTIRVHAMLLGMGAALLIGSAARAQEVNPEHFDDGPFVTTMAQPVPAAELPASGTAMETKNAPLPTAVSATEASVVSDADMSEWTTLAGWAVIAMLIAIALFIRRKIAPVNLAARKHLTKTNGLPSAKLHAL